MSLEALPPAVWVVLVLFMVVIAAVVGRLAARILVSATTARNDR